MPYSAGMKLHMFLALVLAGLCSFTEAAPKKKGGNIELGNVLYIGDSITHGFRSPSYRWVLHKIFVDNGLAYQEIGVETGNHSGGVEPNTLYIGVPFLNVHAAMSGQRAYETSGRDHEGSTRLDGTDIFDWLDTPGKSDSDKRRLGAVPDTAFILLGTNDMLSDKEKVVDKGGIGKVLPVVQKNLLDKKKGDMSVIVDALRKANPKAKVYVLSVPPWGNTRTSTSAKDYEAVVKKYNTALSKRFKKEYVDLNQGLVDIANTEKPGQIVPSFINAQDQLHPTPLGDLIMGGLVAQTMGVGGRTAGMPRKAASSFAYNAAGLLENAKEKTDVSEKDGVLTLNAGKALVTQWKDDDDVKRGFTAEFTPVVGNGAEGGWDKAGKVALTVGNGTHTGKIVVSECYITWNGQVVLYPLNMAKNRLPIRVAWIPGSKSQNVNKGFYVWLGDMLIGEGMPDVKPALNGVSVANLTDAAVEVKGVAADVVPVAPVTKGLVKQPAELVYDEEEEPAPAADDKKADAEQKPAAE